MKPTLREWSEETEREVARRSGFWEQRRRDLSTLGLLICACLLCVGVLAVIVALARWIPLDWRLK